MSDRDRNVNMTKLNSTLRALVDKIRGHDTSWPFLEAVDAAQVCLIFYCVRFTTYFIFTFLFPVS